MDSVQQADQLQQFTYTNLAEASKKEKASATKTTTAAFKNRILRRSSSTTSASSTTTNTLGYLNWIDNNSVLPPNTTTITTTAEKSRTVASSSASNLTLRPASSASSLPLDPFVQPLPPPAEELLNASKLEKTPSPIPEVLEESLDASESKAEVGIGADRSKFEGAGLSGTMDRDEDARGGEEDGDAGYWGVLFSGGEVSRYAHRHETNGSDNEDVSESLRNEDDDSYNDEVEDRSMAETETETETEIGTEFGSESVVSGDSRGVGFGATGEGRPFFYSGSGASSSSYIRARLYSFEDSHQPHEQYEHSDMHQSHDSGNLCPAPIAVSGFGGSRFENGGGLPVGEFNDATDEEGEDGDSFDGTSSGSEIEEEEDGHGDSEESEVSRGRSRFSLRHERDRQALQRHYRSDAHSYDDDDSDSDNDQVEASDTDEDMVNELGAVQSAIFGRNRDHRSSRRLSRTSLRSNTSISSSVKANGNGTNSPVLTRNSSGLFISMSGTGVMKPLQPSSTPVTPTSSTPILATAPASEVVSTAAATNPAPSKTSRASIIGLAKGLGINFSFNQTNQSRASSIDTLEKIDTSINSVNATSSYSSAPNSPQLNKKPSPSKPTFSSKRLSVVTTTSDSESVSSDLQTSHSTSSSRFSKSHRQNSSTSLASLNKTGVSESSLALNSSKGEIPAQYLRNGVYICVDDPIMDDRLGYTVYKVTVKVRFPGDSFYIFEDFNI
jgi:hypothetical protein